MARDGVEAGKFRILPLKGHRFSSIIRTFIEDPVYFSLVPFTTLYASRLQILVFHDRGAAGFDRFSVNFRQMGEWYKSVWDPAETDQWSRLAEVNNRASVPEWSNQDVRIALEQDAAVTKARIYFLDKRQTSLHLIQ